MAEGEEAGAGDKDSCMGLGQVQGADVGEKGRCTGQG